MSMTGPSTATSNACARSSAMWTRRSTQSKPYMASATDTARAERAPAPSRFRWLPGTRLGQLIVALNLLGLVVLIAGALVLNELRRGLVNARIDSLTTQGELMATVIDQAATVGEPTPALDAEYASRVLQMIANPRAQRARLFDAKGKLIADSVWVADRVEWRQLPPARPRNAPEAFALDFRGKKEKPATPEARAALQSEVATALRGKHVAQLRTGENGQRVVSVSMPIQ